MVDYQKEKELLKQALFKMATGYEYEERIAEVDRDGRTLKVKVIKKHMPPNVKAIERINFLIRCGKWESQNK